MNIVLNIIVILLIAAVLLMICYLIALLSCGVTAVQFPSSHIWLDGFTCKVCADDIIITAGYFNVTALQEAGLGECTIR